MPLVILIPGARLTKEIHLLLDGTQDPKKAAQEAAAIAKAVKETAAAGGSPTTTSTWHGECTAGHSHHTHKNDQMVRRSDDDACQLIRIQM